MARIKKNKKFGAIGKKPPRKVQTPLIQIWETKPEKIQAKPKRPKALKFR